MSHEGSGHQLGVVAVVVAGLALAVGITAAHLRPPSGYEASIYRATPIAFWLGVGVAWLLTATVAVWTRDRGLRVLSTVVGGGAAVAVAGLPLLRSYYYHGSADSLSHLGWIRDLGAGRIVAADLFYPGVHSVAVLTADLAGVGPRRGAMLTAVVVVVAFFVAVPAAVWALTGSERATVVGAFSAFALLPINIVVTEIVIHPITQASLFVAVVLYLLVRYLTADGAGPWFVPTPIGVALAAASTGLVLYHPQGALGLLVLMTTATVLQLGARWRHDGGPVVDLRPMLPQTVLLGVVFFAWAGQHDAFLNTLELAVRTLTGLAEGEPTPVAGVATQRSASLTALGGSLFEIYLKLFLASTAYALLVGLLFLRSLRSGVGPAATDGVVRLVVVGLAGLTLFAGLHFLGALSTLVYRYVAVAMTVVTVLGAVALHHFVADRWPADGQRRARSALGRATLVVVLVSVIALSVPTAFASPYVYQPSTHVSEQQLAGYGAAFETAQPETRFVGIRWPHYRFQHAVQGTTDVPWGGTVLRPAAINASLGRDNPTDRYVVVTRYDRTREIAVYRELRYTRADFRTIATRPGIDRVRTNGGVTVYYDPED